MLLLLALWFSNPAWAVSRYMAPNSSCASLHRAVQAEGKVIIYFNAHEYDQAVADGSFCFTDEKFDPFYTKARDQKSCFIGYKCKRR